MKAKPLRVLLVEDEEGIRGLLTAWLEGEGAVVVAAGDGDEAAQCWEAAQADFQLLLTDVMMPGSMDGITLGETLSIQAPDLKVLVISAFLGGRTDVDFSNRPNWLFQPKPFTLPQIKGCVESLVGPLAERR